MCHKLFKKIEILSELCGILFAQHIFEDLPKAGSGAGGDMKEGRF
jgi:hypothetical protein